MAHKRVLLIDGSAVAYRGFYAVRGLSTAAGRPTNAIFGFVRMLGQMRATWEPSHWMVAFDGGLPEARLALLEDYKAQRKPMPDELREQFDGIRDYLDRAGVCWVLHEGEEADDLMASTAEWAVREGAEEVLLATGDKDMYQLVGERIVIVPVAGKGGAMDRDGVTEKTGVPPELIPEWLAITGDSSDNIPGVPGVGPKTAARLLREFGSLDALERGLSGLGSEKLKIVLAEHWPAVRRNLQMVQLRRDLDVPCGWPEMAVRDPDPERLLPLLRELEFSSMVRDLEQQGGGAQQMLL